MTLFSLPPWLKTNGSADPPSEKTLDNLDLLGAGLILLGAIIAFYVSYQSRKKDVVQEEFE